MLMPVFTTVYASFCSMFPLLVKDQLAMAYFALSLVFFCVTKLTAVDPNNPERVASLTKLLVGFYLLEIHVHLYVDTA